MLWPACPGGGEAEPGNAGSRSNLELVGVGGEAFFENLSDTATLGKGLLQQSIMKQLSEMILTCSHFFIGGGFERIHFFSVK